MRRGSAGTASLDRLTPVTRMRGVAGTASAAARRSLRGAFAPSTAPVWIAAVLVLALVIAFLSLGGLRAASRTPGAAAADQEVRTSLYAITVHDAELVDEVEEHFWKAKPDEQLLILSVRLENLTDHPVSLIGAADGVTSRLIDSSSPLLSLSDVTATDPGRAWRDDGSRGTPVLQPGVPAEIVIGWPVPRGSFADGDVRLNVQEAREVAGQIILSSSSITWRRTALVARITVGLAS